jgi:hypothetical protein
VPTAVWVPLGVVVVEEVDVDLEPGTVDDVPPPAPGEEVVGVVVAALGEVVGVVPPLGRPESRLEPGCSLWKPRTAASPAAVAASTIGARLIALSPTRNGGLLSWARSERERLLVDAVAFDSEPPR